VTITSINKSQTQCPLGELPFTSFNSLALCHQWISRTA